MEIKLSMTGFDKLKAGTAQFQKRYPRAISNAMRRAIRRDITKLKQEIRTNTSVGQAIWGKGGSIHASALNKIVTLIRPRVTENGHVLETGIKLKGMAKMIEEGGRTKPHVIKGKPWLAFEVAGKKVFARKVSHPGGTVHAHGLAAKMIQNQTAFSVGLEIRQATNDLMGQVFG